MDDPLVTKVEHIVVAINGASSSSDEQAQHEAPGNRLHLDPYKIATAWNWIELVLTLVLTFSAIVFLTQTENHQKKFSTLLIGYICASIATLPILFWRFRQYSRSSPSPDRRISLVMNDLKTMLEYFFVGWVVLVLWHLINNHSSLDDITQHFWLWMPFIVISFIRDVIPNLKCAAICFLYPAIEAFSGAVDYIEGIDNTIMSYLAVGGCIIVVIACICERCNR